ncbi:MAG: TMEM175 family protein [Actinobacteria bacterium]|nr:TMEM175 family protein [Actinomycetota bacterium]
MESSAETNKVFKMDEQVLNVNRIGTFSDSVFAVAITLLVLNIHVPSISLHLTNRALDSKLGGLWPNYEAFILSFVIIGIYWILHHLMFRYIERYNGVFLWLNLFFLMCIVFMPFTASLISEYGDTAIATIVYAANLAVASLLMAVIWWYAIGRGQLMMKGFDVVMGKHAVLANLCTTVFFLASMPIALANPRVAKYFWLLLIPVHMLLEKRRGKKLARAERQPSASSTK